MKVPSTYSTHLSQGRRLVCLGIITYGQNLTLNMVVVAAVAEGINTVSVEVVAAMDAGGMGDLDAAEAANTKEGDVAAVGG